MFDRGGWRFSMKYLFDCLCSLYMYFFLLISMKADG